MRKTNPSHYSDWLCLGFWIWKQIKAQTGAT